MIIYMYEEWFEKLAKTLDISNIIDNKNFIDVELSENISRKINGEELFIKSYNISKNFKLSYKNEKIHIILNKDKLSDHYIIYLIKLLIIIKEMIK